MGGADELAARRGQHRRTRDPRQWRQRKDCHCCRRQYQLAQDRAEWIELASNKAVDQIKAAPMRRSRIDIEPTERRGRHACQVIKQLDQQQTGKKGRQRDPGGGDDATSMIDQRAETQCCRDAER